MRELVRASSNLEEVPMGDVKRFYTVQMMIYCYEFLRSHPGNLTARVMPGTLDGIRLSDMLMEWDFSPIRRVWIPKGPGSKDLRPLGIAPPKEKI